MKKIDEYTYEYQYKEEKFKIIKHTDKYNIYHNSIFGWHKCGVGVSLNNCKEVIDRYVK